MEGNNHACRSGLLTAIIVDYRGKNAAPTLGGGKMQEEKGKLEDLRGRISAMLVYL